MSEKQINIDDKKEKNRQAQDRYRQSEKGKAAIKKYRRSESRKKTQKRYAKSVKGKTAVKKYAESVHGKAVGKVYRESKRGKKVHKKANKKWNKENGKAHRLMYKYGLTTEQHEQMYAEQSGCCAICEELVTYSAMHTDHNHKTGEVRGLLCSGCNLALGMVKESIVTLKNMQTYLK